MGPDMPSTAYLETARRVLRIEAHAVAALAERLDERFDHAVELLVGCQGRVVVTGMGKSGLICQKIAATLSSTGRPSFFMHPAEALHGDLGMIVAGDVLLAVSNSGETDRDRPPARTGAPTRCQDHRAERGSRLDAGASRRRAPRRRRGPGSLRLDLVPTASTTAALAMGDALAVACLRDGAAFRRRTSPGITPADGSAASCCRWTS